MRPQASKRQKANPARINIPARQLNKPLNPMCSWAICAHSLSGHTASRKIHGKEKKQTYLRPGQSTGNTKYRVHTKYDVSRLFSITHIFSANKS